MSRLGSFGAAVREYDRGAERDVFDFCGEQFTVHGRIPPMLMLQLGAAASGKVEEMEGMAAIWEAMRCSLTVPAGDDQDADPAEFQRFYRLAVSNLVELEELIRLAMALFEAQAGRPTGRQPDSRAGLPTTSTTSNASAPAHPALRGMTPVDRVLVG